MHKFTAFRAPETHLRDSQTMDEWAVGVILFYMFSGAQYPTFKDKKVKFTEPVWKNYVHAKPVK